MERRKLTSEEIDQIINYLKKGRIYYFGHYQGMKEKTFFKDGMICTQVADIETLHTEGWDSVYIRQTSIEDYKKKLSGQDAMHYEGFITSGKNLS